jgi:hypothetical protein
MVLIQTRNHIVTVYITYVLLLWASTSYPWETQPGRARSGVFREGNFHPRPPLTLVATQFPALSNFIFQGWNQA